MPDVSGLARVVFEPGWEQRPGIDECGHSWRSVAYRTATDGVGFVERCELCGCPRCPREGCTDRRHHDGVHVFEDGSFAPIGGVLPAEPDHVHVWANNGRCVNCGLLWMGDV